MAPPTPPVVRVLAAGAALTLAGVGCAKEEPPTSNPPAPPVEPPPEPPIMTNPPPPDLPGGDGPAPASTLPTWESVESGHPEGATNPPRPVLAVTQDGRCFKEWVGGMMPPDPNVMSDGGRVISGPGDTSGTEVQCPPTAKKVLEAHAARQAGGKAPDAPDGEN